MLQEEIIKTIKEDLENARDNGYPMEGTPREALAEDLWAKSGGLGEVDLSDILKALEAMGWPE